MLSQTSEYALRALIYLGRMPTGTVAPAEVIAEALGAPRNYLSKTLNMLAKRGFVSSTRGPAGGFQLAVPARTLTLAAVIRSFDEPRTNRICLLGGKRCEDRNPCGAHYRWTGVTSDMWAPLQNTTIADLLEAVGPDRSLAAHAAD